jgi:Na+-driven multidrug efflux pump/anti-sigma regulatory factor (Ser/Thr protein kinase)
MDIRNTYLTHKAFKIYLGASILTALSSMLGNIVDSIIVSNMISHDAMSAVSLARPLIQLYYTFYLLIGLGGSLLVAFAMGKNDRAAANRTFTVVVGVLAAFSLLVTLAGLCCPQQVVDLFCTNAEVYGYALSYFSPVLWGCIFYMGSFFFGTYTTVDGAPKLVSAAMTVDNICNLCFDVILISWLDMGTAGSAIASNVGHLAGIAIMASHYLGGRSAFRLVRVGASAAGRSIAAIARSGAPFAVASICLTVYMYTANIIIQEHYGASGIYIFSVMLSLLTFYNFFLSGACNTLQPLGAMLVGMGDMVGLRLSVNATFRFLTASLIVCCCLLWIVPAAVCRMFGCPDELLPECCDACRIYAVAFIFFCLIYLLMVNYKLLKEETLSNFLSLALSLSVIPVIWIIANYLPQAIWWSNLVAYLIVFIVAAVWSERRRKEGASRLTLLPMKEANPTLDFSAGYSDDGLRESLTRISAFMNEHGVDEADRFAMKLSAEELLKNIIQHSHTDLGKKRHAATPYIDIRLTVLADEQAAKGRKTVLSLRDDGRPFDPTMRHADNGGYGLKLSTAFSQKLTYRYMFGQNISIVEV